MPHCIVNRRLAFWVVVAAFMLSAAGVPRAADPPAETDAPPNPTDTHELYHGGGFDIAIPKEFIDDRPEEARAALETLSDRLEAASAKIPADRLDKLADVRFLIEWKPSRGRLAWTRAHYVTFANAFYWDSHYAGKEGSVEVLAESELIGPTGAWVTKCQPYWALHELAHAYHDRVLGAGNDKVRRAYNLAMERGLYDHVVTRYPVGFGALTWQKGRAYAATNEWEYFAELSVSFLATNPTFPHNRKDLRAHDPEGYELMVDAWER